MSRSFFRLPFFRQPDPPACPIYILNMPFAEGLCIASEEPLRLGRTCDCFLVDADYASLNERYRDEDIPENRRHYITGMAPVIVPPQHQWQHLYLLTHETLPMFPVLMVIPAHSDFARSHRGGLIHVSHFNTSASTGVTGSGDWANDNAPPRLIRPPLWGAPVPLAGLTS